MTKIVVGVDGSPQSERALRWADQQARLTGSELHAVIAWHLPTSYGYAAVYDDADWAGDARETLDRTIKEALGEDDGVYRHVREGHPAAVLVEAAKAADLLVVGSRGHGGFAGLLLGSVSQHVVAHAACPVVVVPPGVED
jgi:nucleotide-binding universal stress UspA family protein